MSCLSGTLLEQLLSLPLESTNKLQYAWEQETRRQRRSKDREPLLLERRAVCASLQAAGMTGAQVLRLVPIAGFMIEADVTVARGGHAVVLLLDGPEAYLRGGERRLLGRAAWRQQLLQSAGWIVGRIHWHEWREATDEAGRVALVTRVLNESVTGDSFSDSA